MKLLALLAVAAVTVTVAWTASAVRATRDMSPQDQAVVHELTGNMKTVCIGRFLIDMPDEAHIELTRPRISGFDISAYEEPVDEFTRRLADREKQIRDKADSRGGNRNLEIVREVRTASGLIGKIFIHGRSVTEGTRANGLEIEHYRYEAITAEAMVHGKGVSIDLAADDYDPDQVENLSRLVAQLVPNPENEIPSEPGFCINLAYFIDPLSAEQGEEAMMFARLPSHPDIDFLVTVAAGLKPDEETLLERTERTPAWLALAQRWRVAKVRAGRRTIAGLDGEELIRRVHEENDARVYSFWWEINGTEDNVYVPHFVFKMNTGKGEEGPVQSSLSEAAAIGLWDRILAGIRVRPTAVPKVELSSPVETPLGAHVLAGDACPQSGWWQCSEGGHGVSVLGGQRRYIRRGNRMPQALLLPPQTLWEKVRGIQPSYESKTRTSWKLMDKRSRPRQTPQLALASAGRIYVQGAEPPVTDVPVGAVVSTGEACPAISGGTWNTSSDPLTC